MQHSTQFIEPIPNRVSIAVKQNLVLWFNWSTFFQLLIMSEVNAQCKQTYKQTNSAFLSINSTAFTFHRVEMRFAKFVCDSFKSRSVGGEDGYVWQCAVFFLDDKAPSCLLFPSCQIVSFFLFSYKTFVNVAPKDRWIHQLSTLTRNKDSYYHIIFN